LASLLLFLSQRTTRSGQAATVIPQAADQRLIKAKVLKREDYIMQALNHTQRLAAATLLALCLGSYWYSTAAEAAEVRDISKVNGGIRVDAEDRVGNVSSVNGGVNVRRGASAYDVETVNGGIDLEGDVVVTRAETVNGGIRIGNGVTVKGSLLTVNGGISTGQGTVIEERVQTVNGKIRLNNTRVGEDLRTSNGDIELRDGSFVEGDLVVRGRQSWLQRFFSKNHRPSEIVIDSSSGVRGDIPLYREVELRIDDEANVGDIIYHYQ